METLIRRFCQLKMAFIYLLVSSCSFLCRHRPWVLLERGVDARDNAYFFYRFLKKNYPEQKIYYIIDKVSPDYPKVKEDAVHFGSLKNYWVIATAEKIISTHCYNGLPHLNLKLFRFLKLNKRHYFLQHGVVKDDMPRLYFDKTGIQLFICGAKPEFDYIVDRFGYPPGAVRYTGLARYDTLHNAQTKRQILLMPTWRAFISNEEDFLKSQYFCQWNQLLSDRKLLDYLEKNDLTAVFYPHFEVQKYLRHFRAGSERVILADYKNYDVQTLLKESKLLVTDYSSVYFDFAYMRKPVVYFQFDSEDFFAKHYSRGYFSYSEMGFGPVVDTVDAAADAILESGTNDFVPTDMYSNRMKAFFPLYDRNNCERIYDAIRSM